MRYVKEELVLYKKLRIMSEKQRWAVDFNSTAYFYTIEKKNNFYYIL